jgi:hypothetical protein
MLLLVRNNFFAKAYTAVLTEHKFVTLPFISAFV